MASTSGTTHLGTPSSNLLAWWWHSHAKRWTTFGKWLPWWHLEPAPKQKFNPWVYQHGKALCAEMLHGKALVDTVCCKGCKHKITICKHFFNAKPMQIKIAHFWKCTYMESQEVLAFLALFLLAISSSEQRIVKNVPCSTLALFLRIGTWKPFSVLAMWTSMLPPGLFTKLKNGTKIPVFFSKSTFGGMIWNLKSPGQWIKVMLAFTSFTWATWPMGKIFSLPLAKVLLHCGRPRGTLIEIRHSPHSPHSPYLPWASKLIEIRHSPHSPHLPW